MHDWPDTIETWLVDVATTVSVEKSAAPDGVKASRFGHVNAAGADPDSSTVLAACGRLKDISPAVTFGFVS